MTAALLIVLPILMVGVVVALVLGLRSFTQEGVEARARSNRMMQWRIGLQFAAVVIIVLIVLVAGG